MRESKNSWTVYGYISVALLAYSWSTYLQKSQKLNSLVYAAGFSIIEFIFTSFHSADKDGKMKMNFPHINLANGHTTWPQFWCNTATLWLFIDYYMQSIPSPIIRLVLFPINIWLLEVIEGYFLIFLYGRNVAWTYEGSDAFFSGNVKLSYWKYWLMLSGCLEIGYPTIQFVLEQVQKIQ